MCNWWIPGQRKGEEAEYRKWAEYGDRESFTSKHGPMYVPVKVEDGGKWLVIGSDKDGEADLAIGRQQAPYHDRR